MQIALDAMGSDNHPEPEIQAALQAAHELEIEVILVGSQSILEPRLREIQTPYAGVTLVDAPETLQMTDDPARAARRKHNTSMAVGMDLVKSGQAAAFVTAGSTGGAMANGLFRLGRIRGVKRPGLLLAFPVHGGRGIAIDVGANTECRPAHLLQFAGMGVIYSKTVLGRPEPSVGLLSTGEEEGKGNQLVKDTFPLLAGSGLRFIGNVEAKEFFGGHVDVLVTDGFTGNVMLKSIEAGAKLVTEYLSQELRSSTRSMLGALLARPAFAGVRRRVDPAEYGAAPLLGVDGLVFIGHGRSDGRALFNAIRVAKQAASTNLLESIRTAIGQQLESLAAES